MRRAAKVDKNQPEIVEAARAAGATVCHIHTVGKGCPDVMVGVNGYTLLIEIKGLTGDLTSDEAVFHATWRGHVAIVRTAEEMVGLIKQYRRKLKPTESVG